MYELTQLCDSQRLKFLDTNLRLCLNWQRVYKSQLVHVVTHHIAESTHTYVTQKTW